MRTVLGRCLCAPRAWQLLPNIVGVYLCVQRAWRLCVRCSQVGSLLSMLGLRALPGDVWPVGEGCTHGLYNTASVSAAPVGVVDGSALVCLSWFVSCTTAAVAPVVPFCSPGSSGCAAAASSSGAASHPRRHSCSPFHSPFCKLNLCLALAPYATVVRGALRGYQLPPACAGFVCPCCWDRSLG